MPIFNRITYGPVETKVTKYSHTPNVKDDGTQNGNYTNNMSTNDVVTIPGRLNSMLRLPTAASRQITTGSASGRVRTAIIKPKATGARPSPAHKSLEADHTRLPPTQRSLTWMVTA